MGNAASRSCSDFKPYMDSRGYALHRLYGVPEDQLRLYPEYTSSMGSSDLAKCKRGVFTRRKLVKLHDIAGKRDLVKHALKYVHGIPTAEHARYRRAYGTTMAVKDIKHHAQHGKAYYTGFDVRVRSPTGRVHGRPSRSAVTSSRVGRRRRTS